MGATVYAINMDPVTLIGASGAAVLLVFFILNQFKVLTTESIWYDGANVVGAGLLFLYAYLLWSIPFMILEGVWMLVSLRDVIIDLYGKK